MSAMSRARLHDHDRLGSCERQADAGDLHIPGTTDDLVFQRQSTEHDIDRDSAWLVQDKQHTAFFSEMESIVDAGGEPEFLSGPQERGPFPALEYHEDVDVFRESWPAQNRGGDATDDRAGDGSGIEPFRHRAERLDKRRRRVPPPPDRSTLCQTWLF